MCIRLTHQSVQLLLFSLHLCQEALNVLLIVVQLEQLLLKLAVHLHTDQKRHRYEMYQQLHTYRYAYRMGN